MAALLEGVRHFSDAEKYDAILIDEAHDFEPDWFRCATAMLRGGSEGDLVIAVDGAQSVYGRSRGFTWKSVGVQAMGRSRRFSRNYRNTKQVLEFAWQVAQSVVADAGETETHVRVVPTKVTRQGPVPVYRGCGTVAEEHALIARLVEEFKAKGLAEKEIAVLYPRKERDRIDALCRRLRQSSQVCWISNESDSNGGVRSIARPGIRLLTIHSAKGLEFPAVILTALDQLPNPIAPRRNSRQQPALRRPDPRDRSPRRDLVRPERVHRPHPSLHQGGADAGLRRHDSSGLGRRPGLRDGILDLPQVLAHPLALLDQLLDAGRVDGRLRADDSREFPDLLALRLDLLALRLDLFALRLGGIARVPSPRLRAYRSACPVTRQHRGVAVIEPSSLWVESRSVVIEVSSRASRSWVV